MSSSQLMALHQSLGAAAPPAPPRAAAAPPPALFGAPAPPRAVPAPLFAPTPLPPAANFVPFPPQQQPQPPISQTYTGLTSSSSSSSSYLTPFSVPALLQPPVFGSSAATTTSSSSSPTQSAPVVFGLGPGTTAAAAASTPPPPTPTPSPVLTPGPTFPTTTTTPGTASASTWPFAPAPPTWFPPPQRAPPTLPLFSGGTPIVFGTPVPTSTVPTPPTSTSTPAFRPWFDGDFCLQTYTAAPEFSHSSFEEHRWNHMNRRGNVPPGLPGASSTPPLSGLLCDSNFMHSTQIPMAPLMAEIRSLGCRAELVCQLFSWDLLYEMITNLLGRVEVTESNLSMCPKEELANKVCELAAADMKPRSELIIHVPTPIWELSRGLTVAAKHGFILTTMRLLKDCTWSNVDGTDAMIQAALKKRHDIFKLISSSSARCTMDKLVLGCADSPQALDFVLTNAKIVSPEVIQAITAARPDLILTMMKHSRCQSACLRGIACRSNISTLLDTCLPLLNEEGDAPDNNSCTVFGSPVLETTPKETPPPPLFSDGSQTEQNGQVNTTTKKEFFDGSLPNSSLTALGDCLGVVVSRGHPSAVELLASKLLAISKKQPDKYGSLTSKIETAYKTGCVQHPEFTPIIAPLLPLPRILSLSITNLETNREDRLAEIVSSVLHHLNLNRLPQECLPLSLTLQAIDIGSPSLLRMLLELGAPANDPQMRECPLLYLVNSKNSEIPGLCSALLRYGARVLTATEANDYRQTMEAAGKVGLPPPVPPPPVPPGLPDSKNLFFYYAERNIRLPVEIVDVLVRFRMDPFESRPSDNMSPIDWVLHSRNLEFPHNAFMFLLSIIAAGYDNQMASTMKAVVLMTKTQLKSLDIALAYKRARFIKFFAFFWGRFPASNSQGALQHIPIDVWQQIWVALKKAYDQDRDLAVMTDACNKTGDKKGLF
ncbi:hypothetical protein Pelo_3079 [Pelomyxa schiedti]|nr:hypothetical protein Pelo_3079 [Pelomyxa schiedti]